MKKVVMSVKINDMVHLKGRMRSANELVAADVLGQM
jgi:hypothetical protein